MTRTQLTLSLLGVAALGAVIAPRLAGTLGNQTPQAAPQPPAPPLPSPQVPIAEAELPQAVPAMTGPLTVTAALDRSAAPLGQVSERFLTITLTAPEAAHEGFRRSVDLAVVMDTSGSMMARGKLDYARQAAKHLAASMRPEDVFSLVTFADQPIPVVPATPVLDVYAIHRAVDQVHAAGGTNLYGGLEEGGRQIARSLRQDGVGRVVLLSDGHANVGLTEPNAFVQLAASLQRQGISVSTVGLGLDYNEDMLARIADLGGGTYDFVDDPTDLASVFADELNRSATLTAQNVSVALSLPPGVDGVEVIGWEAAPSGRGWVIPAGSFYAGETKKIIARVRVRGEAEGGLEAARVKVDYLDLLSGTPASGQAVALAEITRDLRVVEASLNAEAAAQAQRAYGNWFLNLSSAAYDKGDREEAKALAQQGSGVLRSASKTLARPELAFEAEDLDRFEAQIDAVAPGSADEKRMLKATKEMSRGRAR
ncbi:MAG: VWA domain-containing protein [Deltaproteobacteria bacterium]|nr:VWA domain-containing protein [Deltaproteobacteria bacterium]